MTRLTDEQLRPATARRDLVYVEAGPGSGKTFLAVERIGHLRYIQHGDDHRGVAAVTFARSAARELGLRVRRRWGPQAHLWPNFIETFDELHRTLLRQLVRQGLIKWPGGQLPDRPEDSWRGAEGVNRRPGKKPWCVLTLSDEGEIEVRTRAGEWLRPSPAFTDRKKYLEVLGQGRCTHAEIRSVLLAATNADRHPGFSSFLADVLRGSFCHLIVDEAFDLDVLDLAVIELAMKAGVGVTLVGDPWQSLYDFRGSKPKQVESLIEGADFEHHKVLGSHRYRGDQMPSLAERLFRQKRFTVPRAIEGDVPDVVIACTWRPLWDLTHLPVLPAGLPSDLDGGTLTSAFNLILHEATKRHFGMPALGFGEAAERLAWNGDDELLAQVYATFADVGASLADVTSALRHLVPDGVAAPDPKTRLSECITRLSKVLQDEHRPVLGLSVHQAKGLEWPCVQFAHASLPTDKSIRLHREVAEHRKIYVALTRAQNELRVWRLPPPRKWQR